MLDNLVKNIRHKTLFKIALVLTLVSLLTLVVSAVYLGVQVQILKQKYGKDVRCDILGESDLVAPQQGTAECNFYENLLFLIFIEAIVTTIISTVTVILYLIKTKKNSREISFPR